MDADSLEQLPPTLTDLLATTVILRQTAPYIPVRGLLSLASTCKTIRSLINEQPDAWRHLDLTPIKSAKIESGPIDVGGMSWRAERMDEALTEDDFYAGPLRNILNRFHFKWTLKYVQTLILDGLSVPADLIREIVSEDRYSVKVLSIREAKNLNQGKLQQVLRFVCRPTRPDGTPKLKALYFFGTKDAAWNVISQQQRLEGSQALGVMASEGAQIGAEWNQRSSSSLTADLFDEETKWFQATGRALRRPQSDWPDTLQVCKGLITFDAVLCRGPRHDITKVDSKDFLQPTIATVALGPGGCEMCHTCPEGPAVFGESHESALPLLGPPPSHSSTVRAAQLPHHRDDNGKYPKLILRCEDCLRGRWCERCNRWWCEDCYQEPVPRNHLRTELQQAELREEISATRVIGGQTSTLGAGPQIKAIGVHRDCWGCGRICDACRAVQMRTCTVCRQEYCPEHDEGCSTNQSYLHLCLQCHQHTSDFLVPNLKMTQAPIWPALITKDSKQVLGLNYHSLGYHKMTSNDDNMALRQIPHRSIAALQQAINRGETTARSAVEGYLNTIESLNPKLNAITITNKSALDDAQKLDDLELASRGPLHGVPFVIKDQIETANIPTAFGSKACKDYVPKKDATIVQKLKQSGALIVAKSTTPDWAASFFSTSSLSGTTANPHDTSRDPGGSSSGSAAAVASGMCLAAIGGDTGGSIRLPASFCGLVGVRVTPGRISRDGMSSLVLPQDTPGPITRTVGDAAGLLDCVVGFDEKDDFTSINAQCRPQSGNVTSFAAAVEGAKIKGRRLGVLKRAFGSHKGINNVLNTSLEKLSQAGAELIDVDIVDLEHYKTSTSPYVTRSKNDINSFLASRSKLSHLYIEDLQRDGTYHPSLDLIDLMVKGPTDFLSSPHHGRQLELQGKFQREVASLFARHELDAIIYPTCQILAPKTQDVLDMKWTCLNFPTNTVIASQLLFPAMTVPIGRARDDDEDEGVELPVGLEILGLPLGEEGMLNVGAAVEEVLRDGDDLNS